MLYLLGLAQKEVGDVALAQDTHLCSPLPSLSGVPVCPQLLTCHFPSAT